MTIEQVKSYYDVMKQHVRIYVCTTFFISSSVCVCVFFFCFRTEWVYVCIWVCMHFHLRFSSILSAIHLFMHSVICSFIVVFFFCFFLWRKGSRLQQPYTQTQSKQLFQVGCRFYFDANYGSKRQCEREHTLNVMHTFCHPLSLSLSRSYIRVFFKFSRSFVAQKRRNDWNK